VELEKYRKYNILLELTDIEVFQIKKPQVGPKAIASILTSLCLPIMNCFLVIAASKNEVKMSINWKKG